jgi:outer membrane scaffolding protein for murein synthesis (MipA/OmpV family)
MLPSNALRCLPLLLALGGLCEAGAQTPPSSADAAAGAADRPAQDDWSIAVGPGVYAAPKYPGARASMVYPIPYQDIEYRHRFFSRGFDFLGAYLLNDDTWQVGADFQLDPTWRRGKDDARVAGLGDVRPTVRGRVFAQATWYFVTLSGDLAQDIAGRGQGLVANGDLFFSLPAGKWMFTVGPGVTWTDRRYMDTFFGVTEVQSSRSGLAAHPVGSGLREWHANAYVTYQLSSRWTALASLTFARLEGDAASSPVTERKQQWTSMAALTYRFR